MAIEQSAVLWAIDVLKAMQPENIPDTFEIVSFEETPRADGSRIVVRGKAEVQLLEGCQPFPVTLAAELFWTQADTGQLKTIAQAMKDAFTNKANPALVATAADYFSFLDLLGVKSDDPEAKEKTRKWQMEIELLAAEK